MLSKNLLVRRSFSADVGCGENIVPAFAQDIAGGNRKIFVDEESHAKATEYGASSKLARPLANERTAFRSAGEMEG